MISLILRLPRCGYSISVESVRALPPWEGGRGAKKRKRGRSSTLLFPLRASSDASAVADSLFRSLSLEFARALLLRFIFWKKKKKFRKNILDFFSGNFISSEILSLRLPFCWPLVLRAIFSSLSPEIYRLFRRVLVCRLVFCGSFLGHLTMFLRVLYLVSAYYKSLTSVFAGVFSSVLRMEI